MGQTSASWRSSHSWGPDPWQGLRADVGLPDQLCVFCDPVFELCLLCYGVIPPDTAVTLQSLSFFPPLLPLGTSLQTSGQFVSTSFSTLTLSSWTGPPHCPLGPCTGCDILIGHSVCIAKLSLWLWSYNFCCWVSYLFISFVTFVVNLFIEIHRYDSSLRVCSENEHLHQFPWGHWPFTWRHYQFRTTLN